MYKYHVRYELNGKALTEKIEATHAGAAFAKCQKLKPGARMLGAHTEGGGLGGYGFTTYEPPQVQRDSIPDPKPPQPLKPKDRTCIFPFYDEVLGRKRN